MWVAFYLFKRLTYFHETWYERHGMKITTISRLYSYAVFNSNKSEVQMCEVRGIVAPVDIEAGSKFS
jgi:hypothetical protein